MSDLLEGEYIPSTAQWVRDQIEEYEASDGARANTLRETDAPIVVITHRGAKSGAIRKIALMRVERDGSYLAVGSYGGGPKDPVWVHNFRAHPEVLLQDGAERRSYTARELTDAEWDEWYAYAESTWPTYASYRPKAAASGRKIPLFLLESSE